MPVLSFSSFIRLLNVQCFFLQCDYSFVIVWFCCTARWHPGHGGLAPSHDADGTGRRARKLTEGLDCQNQGEQFQMSNSCQYCKSSKISWMHIIDVFLNNEHTITWYWMFGEKKTSSRSWGNLQYWHEIGIWHFASHVLERVLSDSRAKCERFNWERAQPVIIVRTSAEPLASVFTRIPRAFVEQWAARLPDSVEHGWMSTYCENRRTYKSWWMQLNIVSFQRERNRLNWIQQHFHRTFDFDNETTFCRFLQNHSNLGEQQRQRLSKVSSLRARLSEFETKPRFRQVVGINLYARTLQSQVQRISATRSWRITRHCCCNLQLER